MRWLFVAVQVAASCCYACSKPRPAPARVDFTVAFAAPRPGTVAVRVPNGETVYAEAEPVLTERDIKYARALRSDGRLLLGIEFGPEGTRLLERVSRANVGNYFVVSLDKAPALALRITGPIPDGMATLEGLPQTEDELRALASRMHGW